MRCGSQDRVYKFQGFSMCDNVQQVGLEKSRLKVFFPAKRFTRLLLVRVLAFYSGARIGTLPLLNESLVTTRVGRYVSIYGRTISRMSSRRWKFFIEREVVHFESGHAREILLAPSHDVFERKSEENKSIFNSIVSRYLASSLRANIIMYTTQ